MLRTSTEYHDEQAKKYDSGYLSPYWQIYNEITWNYVKKCLPRRKKGSLILDAGGGTGLWSVRLAKLGYHVILTDVSRGMLDVARRKIKTGGVDGLVEVIEADITSMPQFKNGLFDLSLAEGDPVSYCSSPKRAIGELSRVTRKGGYVTVSVDSKLRWAARFIASGEHRRAKRALKMGIADMEQDDHSFPAFLFTFTELEKLFLKNGLEPILRVGKPVWTSDGPSLKNKNIFRELLNFELRFCSEPSVAGRGGHIALVGQKQ